MKKIITLLVATLLVSGCIPNIFDSGQDNNANTNGSGAPIQINSPTANEQLTNTYTVTGRAHGSWYFEASFPVTVTDENGNIIVQSFATAQGDWMVDDYVP